MIGDAVFQYPHGYDLKTGKVAWSVPAGGLACGTLSGASNKLFCRLNGFPGMLDLTNKAAGDSLVEVTRPGCWINIVAADGMVLVPEAGSGCSCQLSIHASMGFRPVSK